MSTSQGAPSTVELQIRLQTVADLNARGEPMDEQKVREFLGVHVGIEWVRLRRAGVSGEKVLTLLTERLVSTMKDLSKLVRDGDKVVSF